VEQLRREVEAGVGKIDHHLVEGGEAVGDDPLTVDEVVDGGAEPIRPDAVEDGVGLAPRGEDGAQHAPEVGPRQGAGLAGRADQGGEPGAFGVEQGGDRGELVAGDVLQRLPHELLGALRVDDLAAHGVP